jgi:nicotinic acid mononucleotide adenylyltransferase
LADLALQNLEAEEQLNKKLDTVRNGRKRRSARRRMKFLKKVLRLDTTKPVEVVNTNVTDTTVTAQTLADKTVAKNSGKTRFPKIGHIVNDIIDSLSAWVRWKHDAIVFDLVAMAYK